MPNRAEELFGAPAKAEDKPAENRAEALFGGGTAAPTPQPEPAFPSVDQMRRVMDMVDLASGRPVTKQSGGGSVLFGSQALETPNAPQDAPSRVVRFREIFGDDITADQAEAVAQSMAMVAANRRLAELRAEAESGELANNIGPGAAIAFQAPNGRYNLLIDPKDPDSQQFHILDSGQAVEFLSEFGGLAEEDPIIPLLWTAVYKGADAATLGLLTDTKDDIFMSRQADLHARDGGFLAKAVMGGAELGGAIIPMGTMSRGFTAGLMRAGASPAAAARIGSAMGIGAYSAVGSAEGEARAGDVQGALISAMQGFSEGALFGATASVASAKFGEMAAKAGLSGRGQAAFAEAAGFAVAGQAIHGIDLEQAGVDAIMGALLGAVSKKNTFLTTEEQVDIMRRVSERKPATVEDARTHASIDFAEVAREAKGAKPEKGVEHSQDAPMPPQESGPVEMRSMLGGEWFRAKSSGLAGETARVVQDVLGQEISRLRRRGGTAEVAALKSERATQNRRDHEGWLLRNGADVAFEKASGRGKASQKAVAELQALEPSQNGEYAFSPLYEAAANRNVRGRLSPEARETYDAIQNVIQKRGQLNEKYDAMQIVEYTEKGNPVVDFFRTGAGDIAPRVHSPEMISIVVNESPGSPRWMRLENSIVNANLGEQGVTRKTIRRYLMDIRETIMDSTPGEATQRIAQLEHFRGIPRMPAAIKGDIGMFGTRDWVPILETNPHRYVQALVERGAGRLGYIQEFGQQFGKRARLAGIKELEAKAKMRPSSVEYRDALDSAKALQEKIREKSAGVQTLEAVQKEHGHKGITDVRRVFRSLHGINPEPPILTGGSHLERFARGLNSAMDLQKAALLTSNAITNAPEFLGALRTFGAHSGGIPFISANARYMKTVWKMLSPLKSDRAKKRALLEVARMNAAYTEYHANVSLDPMRPVTSRIRALATRSREFFQSVRANEWQEGLGAVRGLELATMLKSGEAAKLHKLAKAELQADLESIGFNREAARRMIDGKPTKGELDLLVQKVPTTQVAANLKHHELSRFENFRPTKFFIPFMRYASQVGLREHFSRWRVAGKAAMRMQEQGYSKDSMIEFAGAASKVMSSITGKVAQQTAFYLIYAGATGGATGTKIAWNEIMDDPMGFMFESYLYGVLSGPYGAVLRAGGDNDSLMNLTLPTSTGLEVYNFVNGNGRYRGRTLWEKMGQFGSRYVPINRVIENFITSTVGLVDSETNDAHKMRIAERGYWKFRFEKSKFTPKFTSQELAEETVERRAHMRRFTDAIKSFDTDGAEEHLKAYFGVPGATPKGLRDSIRARMKFRPVKDDFGNYYLDSSTLNIIGVGKEAARGEAEKLKGFIGEDAFRLLEAQDMLLIRQLNARKDD